MPFDVSIYLAGLFCFVMSMAFARHNKRWDK